MSARRTGLLGALVMAASAMALAAQADPLFGGDDDPLGEALSGLFGSTEDDGRTEQAARLCLDYADAQVRAAGGEEAHFDRLIEAETEGDRIRLLAEMSADYDDDRRHARVECEVDFEGDNEVVAFRQLETESAALGGDSRRDQAARLCLDHAAQEVRDNGGDDVRLTRVVDSEGEGDRIRLLAEMSADYGDDRRNARVECEVDFAGDNEVVAFRQLGEAESGSFDDVLRDILGQQ